MRQASANMAGLDDVAQGIGNQIQALEATRDNGIKREDLNIKKEDLQLKKDQAYVPEADKFKKVAEDRGLPDIGYAPNAQEYKRDLDYQKEVLNNKDLNASISSSKKGANQLKRVNALLEKLPTGPISGSDFAVETQKVLGTDGYGEVQALLAEFARSMRQPGEGTVSDFDAAQFLKAIPNLQNGRVDNVNISKGIEENLRQQAEFGEFRKAMVGYAGLQGDAVASAKWQEYLEANPIFDPAKADTPTINPNRQTWQQYFRATANGENPALAADQVTGTANLPSKEQILEW